MRSPYSVIIRVMLPPDGICMLCFQSVQEAPTGLHCQAARWRVVSHSPFFDGFGRL